MTINSYIKEQSKIIDAAPDKFNSKVKQHQLFLLSEVRDLIDRLETDGNVIIKTRGNLVIVDQILQRLRGVFFSEDYLTAVETLLSNFDASADLSDAYLTQAFKIDEITALTNTARTFIERQRLNALGLLTNESAIDAAFFNPIYETLVQGVTTGESIRQLNKNIRIVVTGAGEVDGKLLRYSKQIASDSVATADRNYMINVASEVGVEFYRYSGGVISDTRSFCAQRNGNYYHTNEVKKWGTVPAEWQGRFRGTNAQTIYTWLGGYNCKHSLVPVSEAIVPKSDLLRAIEKGYYKPSDAVKKRLGIDN